MSTVKTMHLAELVEDMELYPRHNVDDGNVGSLAMAIKAGCQLPPIIADSKSKRIVDGWHRARAWKRVHGPKCTVEVELRKYSSEAEIIEDAVRCNAAHGRRLDSMDQTRSAIMLQKHGIPLERIALVLHVPEAQVEKLTVRVATSNTATKGTVPGTTSITLKRPMSHLAGKKLTAAQAQAHDMMPGTSFLLIARQLNTAIKTKLVNMEDDKLIEELRDLCKTLEKVLR